MAGDGLTVAYRRSLLLRWSRRDHLAVVTVAVAVAFFTSTVLLVTAVSAQTTAIAANFDSPASVEHVDGGALADGTLAGGDGGDGERAVVLPAVRASDGRRVVGATAADAERVRAVTGVALPAPPPDGVTVGVDGGGSGAIDGADGRVELAGANGQRTVAVAARPEGGTLVPGDWYVGNANVVDDVGATEAYAIRDGAATEVDGAVPLRGALPFFVAAAAGLRELLLATAVGVGALAGAIVYSVARMTVRDRTRTIRVVRATGGTARRVLLDFTARAALLVGVGVALGYAAGVVGTNAVVNAAVYVGLPTSLTVGVTAGNVGTLLAGYGVVFGAGTVAGAFAVLPEVRAEVADVGRSDRESDGGGVLSPTLLSWRVLAPAASALAVFVAVVLVLAAVGAALGPLVAGGGGTVTEPGAVHPVASSVPEGYAGTFEAAGANASAEVLAFTVVDGRATLVRGADYDAFADVSDASLVAGRQPEGRHEAVVGADLARTLDLAVGDELTVGGSTAAAVTTVELVGTYEAPGYHDDQLLVSLPTARHLTNEPSGSVHLVRFDEDGRRTLAAAGGSANATADDAVRVVDLSVPDRVAAGSTVSATATVLNPTAGERTVTLPTRLGDRTSTVSATVPAGGTATVTWTARADATGETVVAIGDAERTVSVLPADAVTVSGLPERVPPNATLAVTVRDLDGNRVNATVTVGDRRATTGADGVARLSFDEVGDRTVTVTRGSYSTQRSVAVAADTERALQFRFDAPDSVTPIATPSPALVAENPWNETVAATVTVAGPGVTRTVALEVPPRGERRLALDLERLSPGSYELSASVAGRPVATHDLAVRGDQRLASALAARAGDAGGATGIGRAIATVFGNVQVVLAVVLSFAGAMSVAGTAAAFAYDVDANARQVGVYRTVGATRLQVLRVLLGDALRIGVAATAVALVAGAASTLALRELGVLRLFGVAVDPRLSPGLLAAAAVACLALTVAGTVLAAVPTLRAEPRALLDRGEGS